MLTWMLWSTLLIMFGAFIFEYGGAIQKKKNLFFNIKIEPQYQSDDAFSVLIENYKRKMKRIRWLGFFALFGIFLFKLSSWLFLYFTLYMFIYPAIEIIFAVRYSNQLKQLKAERGWKSQTEKSAWIDTKLSNGLRESKFIKFKWFVLIGVFCFLPLLLKSELSDNLHYIFAALSLFVWCIGLMLYPFIKKGRNRIFSEESVINIQLNFKVKNLMLKILLILVVYQLVVNAGILRILIAINQSEHYLIAVALGSVLGPILVLLYGYYQYKQILKSIPLQQEFENRSDEAYWVGGIFYNNPNNPKTFVNKPVGIGSTLNLATKTGKSIIYGTLLGVMVLFGFLLMHMFLNDYTDPYFIWKDSYCVVQTVGYKDIIPYDAIEKTSLIADLNGGFKTNGMATDIYARGHFKDKDYGAIKLYIFKNSKPYLFIETQDQKIFYSGRTVEETMQVYDLINEKINS